MKSLLPVVAAAFALGALAFSAWSSEEDGPISGVVPSHAVTEEFDLPLGVTTLGEPGRNTLVQQYRTFLRLPAYYGELVSVTAHGEQAVLWFKDADGTLRNAIVSDPARALYLVAPTRVSNFDVDYHK